jgi:hypothetical protein
MRYSLAVVLLLGSALVAADKPTTTRYGVPLDLKVYPQATAKDALASILKAAEAKRIDYLVAQLADPAYIDEQVEKRFGGKFERQVEDTTLRMNASTLQLFQRFVKDGEWTGEKQEECVRLKDVQDRCVYFRRVGDRWYLENRNKPPAPPPPPRVEK